MFPVPLVWRKIFGTETTPLQRERNYRNDNATGPLFFATGPYVWPAECYALFGNRPVLNACAAEQSR